MNQQVRVNDVGDVVLEHVDQLRALADPERLALFTRLQRLGPQPGAELDPAALDQLATAGLVRQEGEQWAAIGRGLFLQLPEGDPDAARAARDLSGVMLLAVEELPRQWVEQTEPRLDDSWAGAAGLLNAGIALTVEELTKVQEDLEVLLMPYLNREEPPAEARKVRLLAYFLPEAPEHRRPTRSRTTKPPPGGADRGDFEVVRHEGLEPPTR